MNFNIQKKNKKKYFFYIVNTIKNFKQKFVKKSQRKFEKFWDMSSVGQFKYYVFKGNFSYVIKRLLRERENWDEVG